MLVVELKETIMTCFGEALVRLLESSWGQRLFPGVDIEKIKRRKADGAKRSGGVYFMKNGKLCTAVAATIESLKLPSADDEMEPPPPPSVDDQVDCERMIFGYRSLQGTDYEISCPLSMRPPNPTTALWGYLPAPYVAVSVSTTKAGDGSMLELSVNLEGTHQPYMYAAEGLAQLEKVMGVDGGGDREESAASQGEAEGYAQSRTAKNLRMRATEDVISASIVEGTEEATNDQGLAIPGSLENLPGVLEDIPKVETSPDENLWFMALDMNDRCRFQQPDDGYDPCFGIVLDRGKDDLI
ncbi:hypothetical protein Pmar_PMAR008307 [Perkinsus marinus ATCC 50983]|uniref:Uncharacterized protein n=1 Tax=Perkinsus marinus (strain ATCC 50983 / TXsc) TaxID=423536 RepID=C5L9T5_PERM5|nr:hypothetical protein Pmar_PMAR008307 [Perkinsus marinus ATCC 50983]EER06509.1 hypothetical protein Pmar_PMAR008307 [Perkinsus marinus ATCC 50983]|eukprot:XP_002774693.1 hypothetical protein Pmar_PMAR008307 [Perkinsus marinus ATCC 50983]